MVTQRIITTRTSQTYNFLKWEHTCPKRVLETISAAFQYVNIFSNNKYFYIYFILYFRYLRLFILSGHEYIVGVTLPINHVLFELTSHILSCLERLNVKYGDFSSLFVT